MNGFLKTHDFGAKGWKVVIFALLCYSFGGILTDSMNSLYGYYEGLYSWPRTNMALWVTIGTWCSMLTVIVCGALANKLGAKKMMAIGFIGQIIMCVIMATLKSFAMFALACVVNYVSMAFVTSFGIQLLGSNWFPKKKGLYMGICTMGLVISLTFINAVFGWFLNTFGSASSYFYAAAALYAIMLIVTMTIIHNYPEDENAFPDNDSNFDHEEQAKILAAAQQYKASSPWTIKKMLCDRNAWLIGIGFGIVNLMGSGINGQVFPAMLSFGFDAAYINVFLIVILPPALVFSWFGGVLDGKYGPRKATLWFVSIAAIIGCLMVAFLHQYSWAVVVGICLAMSSTSAGNNMTMSITSSIYGRYDFVNAWTVIFVISKLVSGLGAYLVSALADLPGGYSTAYLALAIITVIDMIIIACIKEKFVGRTDEDIKKLMDEGKIKA